ncbi:Glutamate--tRNA ligase mitochondrial [Microbotryomycetes sp. JL221]|nr:Glutamate--tRNA ligase mitochondrial [Microbotryomycetes sp. JL221]
MTCHYQSHVNALAIVVQQQQRRSCSTETQSIKLRFAPSPTGYLHLGGLRTALFNHLLARKWKATWLLRIEDTDQTRFVNGAIESLISTLEWSKLNYDEGPNKDKGNGPYLQSQRTHLYNKHLQRLIDSGQAYHCFCSNERLKQTRQTLQKQGSNSTYDRKCLGLSDSLVQERLKRGDQHVVRFKSTSENFIQKDLIYNEIVYNPLPIEDFVLRKSDGLPTYHFANVVDDFEMGVTHVIRGEEWLPSTPKHVLLYKALGLEPPLFGHLPLLINQDGSKLSKRAGDVRVQDYIDKGYEPEALLNFVALLGWSPQGSNSEQNDPSNESDLLTLEELIQQFSLKGINKNRPTMNQSKLNNLNRAHIRRKLSTGSIEERNELVERIKLLVQQNISNSEPKSNEFYLDVLWSLKDRLYTIKDVINLGSYFFQQPDLTRSVEMIKSIDKQDYVETLQRLIQLFKPMKKDDFKRDTKTGEYQNVLNELHCLVEQEYQGKVKLIMTPLRHALTGQHVGATVASTIGVLGQRETIKRLELALEHMSPE